MRCAILKLCWAFAATLLMTSNSMADDASSDKILTLLYKAQEELANDGNVSSMFLLGTMYEEGTGVEQDYKLALLWYQRADKNGHPDAANRISKLTAKENSWPATKHNLADLPVNRKPRNIKLSPEDQLENVRARQEADRLKQEAAKVQELKEQLAHQKMETENARRLADKTRQLEAQLQRERAAETERIRLQVEKSRQLEEQLAQERAAAQRARQEADLARLATESTRGPGAAGASPNGAAGDSTAKAEGPKEFKANPCDTPAARFMSTCH